jgi:hypothetical protein
VGLAEGFPEILSDFREAAKKAHNQISQQLDFQYFV